MATHGLTSSAQLLLCVMEPKQDSRFFLSAFVSTDQRWHIFVLSKPFGIAA